MHNKPGKRFTELIFYGNYFYGLCTVSLMFETTVQLGIPFCDWRIYFVLFISTVLFYNYPYARNYSSPGNNPRSAWYHRNHTLVVQTQIVFTSVLVLTAAWLLIDYSSIMKNINGSILFWFSVIPVAGAIYYGGNFFSRRYNLRQIGWLKPFIIGFVWAGVSNIYPILFYEIFSGKTYPLGALPILLFLKAFMFVSQLAIMFDIKDYASDSNNRLNTMVVKIGLRKTIFYFLIPFAILGLLTFLSYAVPNKFSIYKMILIMIPFFLLILAAISLLKRRKLLYYLVVIDGMLIIKAVFGIAAIIA